MARCGAVGADGGAGGAPAVVLCGRATGELPVPGGHTGHFHGGPLVRRSTRRLAGKRGACCGDVPLPGRRHLYHQRPRLSPAGIRHGGVLCPRWCAGSTETIGAPCLADLAMPGGAHAAIDPGARIPQRGAECRAQHRRPAHGDGPGRLGYACGSCPAAWAVGRCRDSKATRQGMAGSIGGDWGRDTHGAGG